MVEINSGIYQIQNLNGKCYVGSAINIRQRWSAHKSQLRRGVHHSSKLQRAWDKYGEDVFTFKILEAVFDASQLLIREQHWIDSLRSHALGYNVAPLAQSSLGVKHRAEVNAANSARQIGRTHTLEAREKIAASKRGISRPAHVKEAISIANTGRVQPPEEIANRVAKLIGKKRPLDAIEKTAASRRGVPMSEEQKKKISLSLTGRKGNPETARKVADALRGRKRPSHVMAACHASRKGVPLSDGHKKSLSDAQRIRFERERVEAAKRAEDGLPPKPKAVQKPWTQERKDKSSIAQKKRREAERLAKS